MNCNAPIKTMNCNCQKNKEWLYDTKANYTCFKMIFSWKYFVMQCHNRSKVSCTVKPNIQYNIVSLRLPHFLYSLHYWWALRAVAGISSFSTLKQFIFIRRNTFYFTWYVQLLNVQQQKTNCKPTTLISMWNVFIRACNCGENSVSWQTAHPLISSFS